MKVKRKLLKVHFDFPECHLAYTSEDAPACSLLDDPVMFKSMKEKEGKKLTPLQEKLMKKLGKPISKSLPSEEGSLEATPSTSEEVSEVTTQNLNKDKGTNPNMSDTPTTNEILLQKELNVMKHLRVLDRFDLPEDVAQGVAEALSVISDSTPIFKAMQILVDPLKEKITTLEADLDKAKEAKQKINPLAAKLSEEKGVAITQEDFDKSVDPKKAKLLAREQELLKHLGVNTDSE